MAYFFVDNFGAGVDLRKHTLTAPSGTLKDILNGHVTPGGEIQKRGRFEAVFDATANTFGMLENDDDSSPELFVFGTAASGPTGTFTHLGTTATMVYKRLTGTISPALSSPMSSNRQYRGDMFQGLPIVAVRNNSQTFPTQLFYDGAKVTVGSGLGGQIDYIRTHGNKVYGLRGGNLRFSTLATATDWDTTAQGAGNIYLSRAGAAWDNGIALEPYLGNLALFSRRSIQLWNLSSDPTKNALVQAIASGGLVAGGATAPFGGSDVLYLARDGVRSLRARDSSNTAAVSDIGSPIDPWVQERIGTGANYISTHIGVDRSTQRAWVVFPDGQIWILSAYPGPGVTAWSRYEFTDNNGNMPTLVSGSSSGMFASGVIPFLRATDNQIYAFRRGDFDASLCEVKTHYMHFDRPATYKSLGALDVIVSGTWDIAVAMDPDNETWETVATVTRPTLGLARVDLQGYTPHIALRFRTTSAVAATLAGFGVHFDMADEG